MAFSHSLLALTALHTNAAAGAQALYRPVSFSWTWLETAGLRVGFDGLVTEPVLIAMTVITGLHLLVQIYAIGYMEMDWGWPRSFGSLSFFEAGREHISKPRPGVERVPVSGGGADPNPPQRAL